MRLILAVLILILSGCAITPIAESTPEQIEQLNHIRATRLDAAPLVRIDQLQMNNASKVPRAN